MVQPNMMYRMRWDKMGWEGTGRGGIGWDGVGVEEMGWDDLGESAGRQRAPSSPHPHPAAMWDLKNWSLAATAPA